jgi:AcrR family transcriptional regulator
MAPRVVESRRSSARNTDPAEERSRDRILTAALEEFATLGFDGTTTGEIARRAGVTQPLVHYHFASKDALWRAAVASAFQEAIAAFDGVLTELADLEPIDQLKVLVRRYVRFSALHPEIGRIVSAEGARGGPRLQWLVDQRITGEFDAFRVLYERAVDDGALKDLPYQHVMTSLTAAGAYVFMVRAAMADMYGIDVTDPEVIEAHADTLVEIIFHGIANAPPASLASVAGTPSTGASA